jgi:parallel beta-helix repeat protein
MRIFRRSFLVLVFLLFAPSAHARTWFIAANGSGDAPTIQAGVDTASPGDTVLVGPGTYSDSYPVLVDGTTRQVNIHVTKNIVLWSRDGAAATRLVGTANNILILAENVGSAATIHGFDMAVSPPSVWGCVDAIILQSPPPGEPNSVRCVNSSCSISQNVIHDYLGVVLTNSPCNVVDNAFDHNGQGVYCDGSAATIESNTFTDCGLGISIVESSVTVTGNTFRGRSFGAMCAGIGVSNSAGSVYIGHNQFENVYHEAIRGSAPTLTLESNRMISCGYALYCWGANLSVRGNVVTSPGGIYIEGPGVISHNTVVGAAYGIDVLGGAPVIDHNIVAGAGVGVFCSVATPILNCNDIFTTGPHYHGCPDPTGTNGNISVDPLFCGIPGSSNFQLQSVSPCAPGHHPNGDDCGRIGALDVGCGAVKTQPATWGSLKAMYKR